MELKRGEELTLINDLNVSLGVALDKGAKAEYIEEFFAPIDSNQTPFWMIAQEFPADGETAVIAHKQFLLFERRKPIFGKSKYQIQPDDSQAVILRRLFTATNSEIKHLKRKNELDKDAETSLTALGLKKLRKGQVEATFLNKGDSLVYVYNPDERLRERHWKDEKDNPRTNFSQITPRHKLGLDKFISGNDKNNPDRVTVILNQGDVVLLATSGLSSAFHSSTIHGDQSEKSEFFGLSRVANILEGVSSGHFTPREAAQTIISEAKNNILTKNATVLIIKIEKDTVDSSLEKTQPSRAIRYT